MPPVSDSAVVETLIRQLGAELQNLAEHLAQLAVEVERRPAVPLRPWYDAPVRGLPLEEALRNYQESKPVE